MDGTNMRKSVFSTSPWRWIMVDECEHKATRTRKGLMADAKKVKAGEARWKGVKVGERKALVSKAAHARWKKDRIVVAEHRGSVKLAGFEIGCAVLSDGRRVFSERSLSEALGHKRHADEYAERKKALETGSEVLPVFITPKVRPYLSEEAAAKLAKPIRYQAAKGFGIPAFGVDATLLADICEAYLTARDANVLRTAAELAKAAAADKLIRALARVAIVALIDEATGYQVVRDRDELQQLLAKYVSEEVRPWAAVFPNDFYVELFRLRKVKMEDVRKRPQYFGKLTNEIVYERLIPGILPKLQELNPTDDKGRRARKHTQFLSNSAGAQHLKNHLTGVVMLMRSATDYDDFVRRLDRAAPKQNREIDE
ncbi:hypothetical protein EON77_09365 [bacterium]|nr:MAG: hypothetical protein EON77_09365 [bacterium]